jgi:H(+)-translocating pyrophosphatase
MGMFASGVYVLSMSGFGPIADNAGGIVEMSDQPAAVRDITDMLDAVGNVTKANTKGYSIGSASLACFLLFSAYLDEVEMMTGQEFKVIDIAVPEIFVGGLLGSMTVFVFSAWAIKAVGNAAEEVVKEVRRQFKERPGILNYEEKPDYKQCVSIVNEAGLREMVKPGLLAVLSPIIVGVTFRIIGSYRGRQLLGAEALAGFLMFATSTGILMALFFNNGGGAWDNAKKYVETGKYGGKGSDAHKAAVTGDTVGDPCKDTAGPSIHILIKLLSTITLVLVPIFTGAYGGANAGK